MNYKTTFVMTIAALTLSLGTVSANNLQVTNLSLSAGGAGYVLVEFDVSWENSWRAEWEESGSWTNWDAAWVSVKFRDEGDDGYSHASLGTNDSDHVVPAGATLDVGMTGTNGVGVFIYRAVTNSGGVDYDDVQLRWLYAQDGVGNTADVDVTVHAIEMVHVPQGSFDAGDNTASTIQGQFEEGILGTPLRITSEGSLTLGGGGAGSLGNHNVGQMGTADDFNDSATQTLPAAFPKGYAAFYCMKYEITQGQYADFLNQLSTAHATARYPSGIYPANRFTIPDAVPYIAEAPDRACNIISWGDGAAYADWAGIRPMSELEFEKACRGPLTAIPDEYAWGSVFITRQTGHSGVDGSGTETATPAGANCNYLGGIGGPVRVGIFATTNSTRSESGASYWGIMEMGGNVWERPVSVGKPDGRSFTGSHGDGALTAGADFTNSDWPSATTASGAGCRGGNHQREALRTRLSGRRHATENRPDRSTAFAGWRGVRSAP
jgi:formylglycine-generating enzyme required for sulfatase activity